MSRRFKVVLQGLAALVVAAGLAILAFFGWWQWNHVRYSDKAEAATCHEQSMERYPPDLEVIEDSVVHADGVSRPARSTFDRNAAKRNAYRESCIKSCRYRTVFGVSFCW